MYNIAARETEELAMNIPKMFWKYYDLYRRREISLEAYAVKAKLTKEQILYYLSLI